MTTETDPPADPGLDPATAASYAGRADATERAAAIAECCVLAGRPDLTAELMRSGMTVDQVRRHLIDVTAQDRAMPSVFPRATSGAPAMISPAEAYAVRFPHSPVRP